jgi:hypothetical protein
VKYLVISIICFIIGIFSTIACNNMTPDQNGEFSEVPNSMECIFYGAFIFLLIIGLLKINKVV